MWLRETDFFPHIVARLVGAFFERHREQRVGALLADLGITAELAIRELVQATGPAVAHADASGFLQERIREHLRPFYASYQDAAPERVRPPAEAAGGGPASVDSEPEVH